MNLLRHQYILVLLPVLFLAACIVVPKSPSHIPSSTVIDISWPNCKETTTYKYLSGIVGVTGGLDFHDNHCTTQEASLMQTYAVYINTGYAGLPNVKTYQSTPKNCSSTNQKCLAYNWGYNATLAAIKYTSASNMHSQMWWLDVETDNSWSNDAEFNRSSLLGAINAIRHLTIRTTIGIYSSPLQWKTITNDWQIALPTWLATGSNSQHIAKNACLSKSFTGNTNWLVQYTKVLDQNVMCSNQFEKSLLF